MTKLDMLVLFLVVMMSSGIIRVFQAASISSFNLTPTCFCTKELAPVCDNFGMEYSNICAFQCITQQNSSIVLGCSHSCPCEETSPQTTLEPATSTGITNLLSSVTRPDPQLACFCTKELEPVCDIQGQEYSNSCTFRCLNAANPSNTVACNHKCPCEKTIPEKTKETTTTTWDTNFTKPGPQLECFCTKELAPVCDIQGLQYSNSCTFRCLNAANSSNTLACDHKCPCEINTLEKINATTTTWDTNIPTSFTIHEQENGTTIL